MSRPRQYPPARRALTALAAALLAVPALAALAQAQTDDHTKKPPARERCLAPTPEGQGPGTSAKHEITSSGQTRTYILRLPAGYGSRDDWPLIVAYHGRGSTGAEMEGYSELSTLPAIVAYPNGSIGTGSGYRQAWQGAPYQPPGVDDVAFTEDLLDELQGSLCTDTRRTYATGKSNGGGLAALLGCRLPERFAAVAPVAAAYYPGTGEGCRPGVTAPFIGVHGTGDATIPYAGDPARDLPAVTSRVASQAKTNGCTTKGAATALSTDAAMTSWSGCTSDVAHVAIRGGGHVWPGSDVYSGGGYTTRSIETSQIIWKFFTTQRLTHDEGGAR